MNSESILISFFCPLGGEDMKFQQSFLQVPPEAPTQEDGGETFQDGCNDSRGKIF